MWIGSKVPPRIPVRTVPRIGSRWGHQPESTGDVGVSTAHMGGGVDVCAVDPGRHVNTGNTVGSPRRSHGLAACHPGPARHLDGGEVGQRDFEPGHRLDGHRSHPGHRAREGDPARRGSGYGLIHDGGEVDAPVPGVLPCRGIPGDDGPVYRSRETNRRDSEDDQHASPLRTNLSVGDCGVKGVDR